MQHIVYSRHSSNLETLRERVPGMGSN